MSLRLRWPLIKNGEKSNRTMVGKAKTPLLFRRAAEFAAQGGIAPFHEALNRYRLPHIFCARSQVCSQPNQLEARHQVRQLASTYEFASIRNKH